MAPNRPPPLPIDLKKCEYGMTISNSLVTKCFGIEEDDPNFSLAQMKFKSRLEFLLENEIGMPCTICVRDGVLKILTHEEASQYHRDRFNLCILKMMQSFYKNRQVSIDDFDQATADTHNRTLEIQSKVLQSTLKAHPEIKLHAHQRKTPLPMFDK